MRHIPQRFTKVLEGIHVRFLGVIRTMLCWKHDLPSPQLEIHCILGHEQTRLLLYLTLIGPYLVGEFLTLVPQFMDHSFNFR